jgi:hypothetical protein
MDWIELMEGGLDDVDDGDVVVVGGTWDGGGSCDVGWAAPLAPSALAAGSSGDGSSVVDRIGSDR